jgi:hypothetical protein
MSNLKKSQPISENTALTTVLTKVEGRIDNRFSTETRLSQSGFIPNGRYGDYNQQQST